MRTLTGLILIDAGHSALNNAGSVREGQGKTRMNVKKVSLKNGSLPYVSPQAFRYWWRNTIAEESHIAGHGWNLSPIVRGEKTAFTQGNPVFHEDDDIFGYMLTTSADEETEGTVNRRIAPLKCSPLLSVIKNVIVLDEASMMRQEGGFITNNDGNPEEVPGNAVRYKQEWYATILQGAFSLTLDSVGVFDIGNGYDINESIRQIAIREGAAEEEHITCTRNESNTPIVRNRVVLSVSTRRQRIVDTVKSLALLRGGAKLTPYLTDTKPKFVIAAVLSCSNHIFMELIREVDEKASFDTEAFKEVIRNFGDRIISPVYVGWDKGFLAEQRESFSKDFTNAASGKTLRITTNPETNRRQIDFAGGDQRPDGAIDIQISFGSVRDVLEEASQFISTTILPETPQERH